MRTLLVMLGLLLSSLATSASAGEWPEICSEVHPADELGGMVVCPHSGTPLAASVLTMVFKANTDCHPLANAQVAVLLTADNPACSNAVLAGVTDSEGRLTLNVPAGGCADGVPSACVIKVNGVTHRSYVNVKSPDWDGARSDGHVNLADLLLFARQFNGIDAAECHDYTNDNVCNLSDLTIFGEAFSHALHCQ